LRPAAASKSSAATASSFALKQYGLLRVCYPEAAHAAVRRVRDP
jgi:hypothetical protein